MRVIHEQMLPRALQRVGDVALDIDEGALSAVADHHRHEVGMRGIGKSLEGVVSAAAMCRTLGSGRVVGLKDAPVGAVDAAFANHILSRQAPNAARDVAPATMYL